MKKAPIVTSFSFAKTVALRDRDKKTQKTMDLRFRLLCGRLLVLVEPSWAAFGPLLALLGPLLRRSWNALRSFLFGFLRFVLTFLRDCVRLMQLFAIFCSQFVVLAPCFRFFVDFLVDLKSPFSYPPLRGLLVRIQNCMH